MKPTTAETASDHLFATCAPPLTLPLADIHRSAKSRPAGGRRPAFLSRQGARTAARASVATVLPLVPEDWQPRKAIAATASARELLGEDGQPPPPAPRRFKVATPFPLTGNLENPEHQRTVRRRSLGAMLVWPLLAAALLGLGGAGSARAQFTLSGSGLNVSFDNANFTFDDSASHSLTLDSQPLTALMANTWYHVQADANFLTHSTSGSVTAFGGSPVPFPVVPFKQPADAESPGVL